MSWRDAASQTAQDDLDGLLNVALPFAQQMLDQHGEFFPFAASVDNSGEVALEAGDPGQGERPASADVLATLVEGLQARQDDLRAVALCADVRLTDSDGVRVEVEHREGVAIAVVLPYKKKRFGRGIEYRPMQAAAGRSQVWLGS